MMSKIHADLLVRSKSDLSRGIAGSGIAMQAAGHYKNDWASFKAPISRISKADNNSRSRDVDISRISRNRGGSSSRGE